jgi:hypothetical protein
VLPHLLLLGDLPRRGPCGRARWSCALALDRQPAAVPLASQTDLLRRFVLRALAAKVTSTVSSLSTTSGLITSSSVRSLTYVSGGSRFLQDVLEVERPTP